MQFKKLYYLLLLNLIVLNFLFILISIFLHNLIESYRETFHLDKGINIVILIISILLAIVLSFSIFELFTIKEYRNYIIRRNYIKEGNSYLSLIEIFENENRLNILSQILKNPGIHYNELLRNCNLHNGQLQWHLQVLLKNNIIKKEKFGQYTTYLPITSSFDENNKLKNLLAKSKTTSEILHIIQTNPGINSSEISRFLHLSRNTVKYHIDKLFEENLINLERKGRRIELFKN